MTIYLAIDDTDNLQSRGTGNLAREIATEIGKKYPVHGVTRHQLFVHEAIPMTSHNSCAVIHIENGRPDSASEIFTLGRDMVYDRAAPGSDPGVGVAYDRQVTPAVAAFGAAAKTSIVSQNEARTVAAEAGILLEGLGGTEDGVIGAIAGIGLAASRNDGRFVQKGLLRTLRGIQTVEALCASGIDHVVTSTGVPLTEGHVSLVKFPRPAFVNGEAILYVSRQGDRWVDLKQG